MQYFETHFHAFIMRMHLLCCYTLHLQVYEIFTPHWNIYSSHMFPGMFAIAKWMVIFSNIPLNLISETTPRISNIVNYF